MFELYTFHIHTRSVTDAQPARLYEIEDDTEREPEMERQQNILSRSTNYL
jgi:hypothetical protein